MYVFCYICSLNIFCFSGPAHVLPPFKVDQLTKVAYTEAPITLSFVVTDGGNIESVQLWNDGVLITNNGRSPLIQILGLSLLFDNSGFYQVEVMIDQSVRADLKNFLLTVKGKTINLISNNILFKRH